MPVQKNPNCVMIEIFLYNYLQNAVCFSCPDPDMIGIIFQSKVFSKLPHDNISINDLPNTPNLKLMVTTTMLPLAASVVPSYALPELHS